MGFWKLEVSWRGQVIGKRLRGKPDSFINLGLGIASTTFLQLVTWSPSNSGVCGSSALSGLISGRTIWNYRL